MDCKKTLFNPNGKDDNKIYCADSTNLLNLANVKYPEFINFVDNIMHGNDWVPQEVDMTGDKKQYNQILTDDERDVFDSILSFLVFLDSIQTNNLPNIADKITLPEIVYFLARQTYEEALHSRSYGYIFENIMTVEQMNKVVYKFRENEILFKRNELITSWYEESNEDNSFVNLVKALTANYLLEGLYFYNGFQFFHNLASRGLMTATDAQIKFIQRDEKVHCKGFELIINITREENPKLWKENNIEEVIYDMFKKAVDMEIKFSQSIIGDRILGMTNQSIEDYAYYLGNKRLKAIKLEPIFEKRTNPYKHLETLSGEKGEESQRANNFELKSSTYKSHRVLEGWDEI